ncbi:MAG TPA: hypothetical protein DEH78_04585 [Solibacterales bacterium]|nr:hypothetical protein [Bryobacterales bacterium]
MRAPGICAILLSPVLAPPAGAQLSPAIWETDLSKRLIDWSELKEEGPPKDGIPSLDKPQFEAVAAAASWLVPGEPVVVIERSGVVRAYPIQILLWHELVNDEFDDAPILVTYCPLCNSALAFDRRVKGRTHTFGVAGFLRHNDMVMYDRQTDSLWQQITGEAIVGTLTGVQLAPVISRVMPFGAFWKAHPKGQVLSRDTGYYPGYGQTTYLGYEHGNLDPSYGRAPVRRGARLNRVLAVVADGRRRAYTFDHLRNRGVVEDRLRASRYVIFFEEDVLTALDTPRIADSRPVGTAAAYIVYLDGRRLRFLRRDNRIVDRETGSTWDIFGTAVDGPLKGKRLLPMQQAIYFEFAHRRFYPRAEVVGTAQSGIER